MNSLNLEQPGNGRRPLGPILRGAPKTLVALLLALTGLLGGALVANASNEEYSAGKIYAIPLTKVIYQEAVSGGYRVGVFENRWWLAAGVKPSFTPTDNGWKLLGSPVIVATLGDAMGVVESAPEWAAAAAYTGGAIVRKTGTCYRAKWWTSNSDPLIAGGPWETAACPSATSVANPWMSRNEVPRDGTNAVAPDGLSTGVKDTVLTATSSGALPSADNPTWGMSNVYLAGSVVQHSGACYKAKWWSSGDTPKPAAQLTAAWDSPWEQLVGCPSGVNGAGVPANLATSTSSASQDAAAAASAGTPQPTLTTESAATATETSGVAVGIPPVVPTGTTGTSTPVTSPAPTKLPDAGYAFLRQLTKADWDWMFPMRSGYLVPGYEGGARNQAGGSDPFSVDAFIRAVLEYNNWAQINGYKQFLNEGSVKQQAEEFLVFWAKSSRETSGSWSTAAVKPGGWIESQTFSGAETMNVWKGGLYWVEEVGYSTDSATGKSLAINYVDAGSTEFPPSPGRSYYGRGVIQLSWNYNYGAFSHWMFDNGLFRTAKDPAGKCLIETRKKLLDYPNLVADCGDLSILSGIWFWMTPQGAKPSSHDVLYGDVSKVSASTRDMGLPQTNSGYIPKTASGATFDEEVFAYRLGTVINIVNGGLECNKAATWHNGPPQRASYYNAYAAYFNDKLKVGAMRVKSATNAWTTSVTATSPLILQSATCYNQKSYYGW